MAALAAGWKIAAFTRLMSHIWDIASREVKSSALRQTGPPQKAAPTKEKNKSTGLKTGHYMRWGKAGLKSGHYTLDLRSA
jgi:hypothetical protein